MGNNLDCHGVECEEEVIQRVLSSIPLNDIDAHEVYERYNQCINYDNFTLDYFKYNDLLIDIIGENQFKQAHYDFFQNLRRAEDCIGMIGLEFIFLSKGVKEEKVEMLIEHYVKNYKTMLKEVVEGFIKSNIEINTDICIYSFNSSLGIESTKKMREIYNCNRQKKLQLLIMSNYTGLYEKYYKTTTPSPDQLTFATVNNGEKHDLLIKFLKEFIELTYSQLSGEYMRNWLYDEYIRDKPKIENHIC